jgi:DNA-binding PadR family transcriptional regulator
MAKMNTDKMTKIKDVDWSQMTLRQKILEAIREIEGEPYGRSIRKYLLEKGENVSYAKLYSVLKELEEDNCITSSERPGGVDRDYHPKRVYFLTVWAVSEMNCK